MQRPARHSRDWRLGSRRCRVADRADKRPCRLDVGVGWVWCRCRAVVDRCRRRMPTLSATVRTARRWRRTDEPDRRSSLLQVATVCWRDSATGDAQKYYTLIVQLRQTSVQFVNKRVLNMTTFVFLRRIRDHRILRSGSASVSYLVICPFPLVMWSQSIDVFYSPTLNANSSYIRVSASKN